MKFVKIICVVALVFAFSAVAYAETQSVKVSGDITARAFMRDNMDLNKHDSTSGTDASNNTQSFLMSTAEVQIDADLTDNVSGVIRLVNQRAWGDQNYTYGNDPEINNTDNANINAFNVGVDLAYIELKEFLYSPLTLKIGRQDLWFGRGFIVGNSLMDPQGNLPAPEYTAISSFDAIRATFDYDPWTVDLVYAKIAERAMRADDDINLMGINVGYVFDEYNAEMEGYYWLKQDRNPGSSRVVGTQTASWNSTGTVGSDVNTIGLRGSFDPIEDWTVALEGAMQFGQYIGANSQLNRRARFAYAIDAMVETRYFQDQYAWKPVFSVEYILYSGEGDQGNIDATTHGSYNGWDPMYRGKFDTAIREFQGTFYGTTQGMTPGTTNQHQVLMRGTIEPMDDVTIEGTYALFWLYSEFARDQVNTNTNKNMFVGQEIDVNVTWDYTEDVSFGLLTGWFFPGSAFSSDLQNQGNRTPATSVVGTVQLSF
jgi:hypothetical protein